MEQQLEQQHFNTAWLEGQQQEACKTQRNPGQGHVDVHQHTVKPHREAAQGVPQAREGALVAHHRPQVQQPQVPQAGELTQPCHASAGHEARLHVELHQVGEAQQVVDVSPPVLLELRGQGREGSEWGRTATTRDVHASGVGVRRTDHVADADVGSLVLLELRRQGWEGRE